MNEKSKSNIPLSRKVNNPDGADPNSEAIKKRIKIDRTLKFVVKTSNEQNKEVEMPESCTFNDLKPSLTSK